METLFCLCTQHDLRPLEVKAVHIYFLPTCVRTNSNDHTAGVPDDAGRVSLILGGLPETPFGASTDICLESDSKKTIAV